ncbi:MAG: hypothetical protein RR478_02055, partial [Bacilli bacterium]
NVKTEIENKAEKYAKDTSIITMSVQKLIEEGYIEPDKEEKIINPVTKDSLNCKIIEVTYEKGQYKANLTENGGTTNDGTCEKYDVKVASLIKPECYSLTNDTLEIDKCNASFAKTNKEWYSGNVKLSVVPVEGKTIEKYRWSSLTGESSSEATIIVSAAETKSTTYSLSVTYTDGSIENSNLIVKIDNQKPTILNVNKSDEWTSGDKLVTVDASDGSYSGIDKYYIGTSDTCPKSEFTDKNNKELKMGTYYACAMDKSGNVSNPFKFEIMKIDTTKPKTTNATFNTVRSTMGITYYSELVRSMSYTDDESEIAEIKYCFTSDATCNPTTKASITKGKNVKAEFNYPTNSIDEKVCVIGIDSVGNSSDVLCDNTYKVDTTAPTSISVSPSSSNSSVINVSASDSESGINKFICEYGTSSGSYTDSVTVSGSSGSCNIGVLTSGRTYYIRVSAYNNSNLVAYGNTTSFRADVTVDDGFDNICGTGEYCNSPYYINYNGYKFLVYRHSSNGYKAIYDSILINHVYTQSGCCNQGFCTYGGSAYTGGQLSSYLNNTFLNGLPNNKTKLAFATWYTGYTNNVSGRIENSRVGLMDYNEFNATKGNYNIHKNSQGLYWWLLNPVQDIYHYYIGNMTVMSSGYSSYEQILTINQSSGVRPVIVINPDTVFTSGSGSFSDPYVL